MHGLASLVHRSVQIQPSALHLDLGFVAPPGTTHRPRIAVPALLEISSIVLHPAQNRRVRHGNATLSHHGHEIPITQFVAEVPTNAQHHDLLIEVPAFEQLFNAYEPWHVSIIAAPVDVCTRAGSWRFPLGRSLPLCEPGRC